MIVNQYDMKIWIIIHFLRPMLPKCYRVYFGEDGNTVVVLLCGGDKSTQDKDIQTAVMYWKDYKGDA